MTATPLLARFSEINLLDAARGRKAIVAAIRVTLMGAQSAKIVAARSSAETVTVRELKESLRGSRRWFPHSTLWGLKFRRLRNKHRFRIGHLLLR